MYLEIIIGWLYVFGFLGIFLTQAAESGWEMRPLLTDYPSLAGMLAWPITVPLASVLISYDFIKMWIHNRGCRKL